MSSFVMAAILTIASVCGNGDVDQLAIQRGKESLLHKNFVVGIWKASAYENAWKYWKVDQKPTNYDESFRIRYGLHEAPYDNDGLPMGMKWATRGNSKAITIDCLVCHGGSVLGKSYVGLPNTTLDLQLLFRELSLAGGDFPYPWPFQLNTTRGVTNADAVGVFLLGLRHPDLSPRFPPKNLGWKGIPDLDAPAWWLWNQKKTIYAEGGTDARSTRSTMQFLLGGIPSKKGFRELEPVWEDIGKYIRSLEVPKHPFPVDSRLASAGQTVFIKQCARCHGTYGAKPEYPNKIVPIDVIGTDRTRYDSLSEKFGEYFNESWFGEEYPATPTDGYQAPPLTGIWATAPYFHNGSVPTIYHVLNSKKRPHIFELPLGTSVDEFDIHKVGRLVKVLDQVPPNLTPYEKRQIYDVRNHGKSNSGHTFGDDLTENERMAVIEYLKTL